MSSIASGIAGYLNGGRAGKSVSNSDIASENGVLGATSTGQNAVTGASAQNNQTVGAASSQANNTIGDSVNNANTGLGQNLANVTSNVQPYTATGATATGNLANFLTNTPQFSYDQAQYFNSPAYNFQVQQGNQAIQNAASAQGLGASGAAMKQMDQYSQGVAAQYENQAFDQAQSTFNTNTSTQLAGINAGLQAGEFGAGQLNSASLATAGQQSQNTMTGGLQAAQNILSPAEFLAQEGLNSQEYSAGLGLQGATTAGNFAQNAGLANSQTIMNQGNQFANLLGMVI